MLKNYFKPLLGHCFRMLILLPLLLALGHRSAAQTTLVAGDIAFTGYNSEDLNIIGQYNEFSFVILRTGGISAGTVINFTDNGWDNTTSSLTTNEGVITWVATTPLPQFTQVKMKVGITGNAMEIVTSGVAIVSGMFILESLGDQIFAYQGTLTNPMFLAGIHMNSEIGLLFSTASTHANWDHIAFGGHPMNSNRSAIPPGLTNGVNAIMAVPYAGGLLAERNNGVFNCSGVYNASSLSYIRSRINNYNNWTLQNLLPLPVAPLCYFSINAPVAPSANANLSNIGISSGVLSPAFTAGVTNYNATVSNSVSTINIVPTAVNLNASIIVNGSPVASGTSSDSIALATGNNTITILVTSVDGTNTLTYTVVVNRLLPVPVFTLQPVQQILCGNGSVTYTTAVVNADSFAWQFSTNGYSWVNINPGYTNAQGVLTNTLTLVNAGALSGYQFRLAATGAGGTTVYSYPVVNIISSVNTVPVAENVSCAGGSDGVITIVPLNMFAPYTYSWSPAVSNGPMATGLSAGTYTITITEDGTNCTKTEIVTITQPPALTASTSVTNNVICSGDSTGSATVTANGGTAPYTYWWDTDPVQVTATATDLEQGNHYVTVTDAKGCEVVKQVSVIELNTAIVPVISATVNVACFGDSTGSATVTATGGSGAYSYVWNTTPAQTTATAFNLSEGHYTVTVTDANGCTSTVTAQIAQPAGALSAVVTDQVHVSCMGGANGSAAATVSGGTAPYSYSWSNGANTATITSLTAGIYSVTVTDANGCVTTATTVITEPASAVTATISATTDVNCFGAATGSATVTATGGTAPYTYNWSNGNTTAAATNLAAGSYTVTITDGNGCVTTATATITQPASAVSAAITGQTPVSCFGGNNGTATVAANGGVAPYTYSWPNGNTTATATGLAAGSYTVTITDGNGCTTTATVVITQPSSAISAAITSQTSVSCFGGNNGSATVTATGGISPYTYSWPNGNTTATAAGLAAGSYTVTVTDANGCTTTATAVITQPSNAISASVTSQTSVSCFGGNNGTATVAANGGVAPYTYSWPNGNTTSTATGLAAGSYTVTITDANGCTTTATVVITQPASAISAAITSQTSVSCFGGNNGSATVTANGGTAPYSYSWSNGNTTATATGLAIGSYTVTVTDASGCATTTTAVITQPANALSASIAGFSNASCFGLANGSATVAATGGTAPYTYNWAGYGTNATATALGAGTYNVIVTDASGCTSTASVTITQPAQIIINVPASQAICQGNSATITATGADSYVWMPGGMTGSSITVSPGATTTYQVTGTVNGCTATASATVAVNVNPSASAASNSPVNFMNPIMLTATGGNSYVWSGPNGFSSTSQNPQINNTTPANSGVYSVSVISGEGCSTTATVSVTVGSVHYLTLDQTEPASATNFTSLSSLTAYLNTTGVLAPTEIEVVPNSGPYTGQLILTQLSGSSATNTLLINGNGNEISFCGMLPANRDIIRLNGTDHVTLDGFILNATCLQAWGIHLMNGNENVTISNNIINLSEELSIYAGNMNGIIASNSLHDPAAKAGVLTGLTLSGNVINYGYHGIRINGNNITRATDIAISGNELNGTKVYGIMVSYGQDITVNQNQVTMFNPGAGQILSSMGMYFVHIDNGLWVLRNKITNAAYFGMWFNYINRTSGAVRAVVANNMIGGGFRNQNAMGVQLNSVSYLDFHYNSVNTDFGTIGLGMYISNHLSKGISLLNNSFAYTGGGALGRAFHANHPYHNLVEADYNNFYSNGGHFTFFHTAFRSDLAALKAVSVNGISFNQNSIAENPQYESATNLELQAGSQLVNKALPLAAISVDYSGTTRGTSPTIGADEVAGSQQRVAFNDLTVNVYPNPFRDEFKVEMEGLTGKVELKLIDVMGRQVYNRTYTADAGILRVQPDVQLPQGVYILQISNNGKTAQYRVVKQ